MNERQIRIGMEALAGVEPAFAAKLAEIGFPGPRERERGHQTLVQAIISQQVSIKAAAAILAKVEAATGGIADPANIVRTSDDALRAAGLSRQKISYLRSLSEDVLSGRLDFHALPEDDEEAIAALVHVKGIGRWTAEVYLLFAEGRTDIFPAGDLAVQIELGLILGLPDRPTEKRVRELAESWRPYRGAAAIFAWHHRHCRSDARTDGGIAAGGGSAEGKAMDR